MAIGRLTRQKNFGMLIEAFAIARKQSPMKLIILGEGPERRELEQLAAKLGLSADVQIPGADPNPFRMLCRARALVLTSIWEGYPNVLLEARALGIPVIATAYDSSVSEILASAPGSQIVAKGDIQALATAISAAIMNPPPETTIRLPQTTGDAIHQYLDTVLTFE
jgi:glycosyltransferase involved in cell wall biosynthesis